MYHHTSLHCTAEQRALRSEVWLESYSLQALAECRESSGGSAMRCADVLFLQATYVCFQISPIRHANSPHETYLQGKRSADVRKPQ